MTNGGHPEGGGSAKPAPDKRVLEKKKRLGEKPSAKPKGGTNPAGTEAKRRD